MALKPQGNNIVGGTSLVIDRINSPNYVTGVSGWTINQDGSAEFNNVTIRGGTVIGGTSLYYSTPAPAANTLVASVGATAGTDTAGNDYLAGEVTYHYTPVGPSGSLAVVINDAGITWYAAPSGSLGPWGQIASIVSFNTVPGLFLTALAFKFTRSTDGNLYTIGRQVTNVPFAVTVNSAVTPVPIVSANVGALRYRVGIRLVYLGGGTGANAGLSWFGTSTVSNTLGVVRRARGSTNTDNVLPVNQNSALGSLALPFNAGELCTYEFDGQITFSGAGTFGVQGLEGTAGDTWTVATNSYLELIPT